MSYAQEDKHCIILSIQGKLIRKTYKNINIIVVIGTEDVKNIDVILQDGN